MTWRRMLFSALLCLAAAPVLGAEGSLPGYLAPGARVVIGIRVRSLMDASAATGFSKEAQETVTKFASQSSLGGIDIFRDLDEVWFSTTGVGQNPPFLAVMSGRFSERAFSSGGSRYRNATIMTAKQNAKLVVALVDANTALAGNLALVKSALDRGDAASQVDQALAARVAALRGKYDIWGAGNPVPGLRKAAAEDPLNTLDRFDFGMKFTRDFELVADLHVRSTQDLEKLSSTLKFLEAALKAQPTGGSGGRIELSTSNGGIHLAMSIPEEEFNKAIAAQRNAITSAVAAQLAARGVATPVPANAATPSPTNTAAPVRVAPPVSRPGPTGETQVLKNARGETVMVTLPGKE